MMKAIGKDQVIAESDDIVEIDGERYFPWDSLNGCYFMKSETTSSTPLGTGLRVEAMALNMLLPEKYKNSQAP